MNTSASAYTTIHGEVTLILLDQVTQHTLFLIIKNSKNTWDQDIRMRQLGAEAMGNSEKNSKPLFTSGSGKKRTQDKSLWNLGSMKYFHRAEKNGSRFMIV
jgi:hypothetical protein